MPGQPLSEAGTSRAYMHCLTDLIFDAAIRNDKSVSAVYALSPTN
jgi:hypothetical protein